MLGHSYRRDEVVKALKLSRLKEVLCNKFGGWFWPEIKEWLKKLKW